MALTIANGETGIVVREKINKLFPSFNPQTDDYTLVLGDAFKTVQVSKASAVNLTVPPNASVAFEIGTKIPVMQTGAGLLTIVQGAGVTVTASSGSLNSPGQNVEMILTKTGTNTWDLQNGTAQAWASWVPVYTGFSVAPVVTSAKYFLNGKAMTLNLYSADGTSNAPTLTVTMPFNAANNDVFLIAVTNSGTRQVGRAITTVGSNVLTVHATAAGGAFTGSGNKSVWLAGVTLEIQP